MQQKHLQDNEMEIRWFTNRLARRRLNDQIMDCARAALPELMRRQRNDEPIDPDQIADEALQIGLAMGIKFTKEKLLLPIIEVEKK